MMQGVEHDETISIYTLQMLARRLLRRPAPAGLLAMTIPRFFNSPITGDFPPSASYSRSRATG